LIELIDFFVGDGSIDLLANVEGEQVMWFKVPIPHVDGAARRLHRRDKYYDTDCAGQLP
jgi:hypothetical protein